MRRALATLAVASVLFSATAAFAKDDPPPPPPPPSSDSSASDSSSSSSDSTESSSGSSSFRASDALLDRTTGKKRPMMLSFFAGIEWNYYYGCGFYYGACGFPLGLGARFNIPLVHDGFLPMLNDSFDLEFGIDANLYFGGVFGVGLAPVVAPRWTFYLLPKLWAYAAVAIGIGIYPGSAFPVRFYFNPAVGIVFKVTDSLFLRAEIGYGSLKGGLGIAF